MLKNTKKENTRFFKNIAIIFMLVAFVLLAIDAGLFFLGKNGFWINTTNSMPIGIYKEVSKDIERNDLVLLCVVSNDIVRSINFNDFICKDGHKPLLKRIVAVEDDIIVIDDNGVYVNDKKIVNSERQTNITISKKNFRNYTIRKGEYVVLGDTPLSWDSRYFGIVKSDEVIATVKPILTY